MAPPLGFKSQTAARTPPCARPQRIGGPNGGSQRTSCGLLLPPAVPAPRRGRLAVELTSAFAPSDPWLTLPFGVLAWQSLGTLFCLRRTEQDKGGGLLTQRPGHGHTGVGSGIGVVWLIAKEESVEFSDAIPDGVLFRGSADDFMPTTQGPTFQLPRGS
jgi:hypothetical protein